MTKKEMSIARAILTVLHETDGGQLPELPLHAEVNLLCACTRTEFELALRKCDTERWVLGVRSRFKGVLWSVSDGGQAALAEM